MDAIVISNNTYIDEGRAITETVYNLPDGTVITDTLDVSAISTLSDNGIDTVTRKRNISGWGTITIEATFKWYTEGCFSYVQCKRMSAYYLIESKVAVENWTKTYTSEYVSIGKAKAQVEYHFYNSEVPFQYQKGTFKITCTDSGTIKDNG